MARHSVEVERREQILRSACAVIASNGVIKLRVADVARGAGVSPAIVHYYFDNKIDLIRAAFDDNFQRSLERRTQVFDLGTYGIATLYEVVDSYLPTDAETIQAWHVWIELWAAALQDGQLQTINERAYGEWRALVSRIIASGQSLGEVREGEPTVLANMLVGMLDGLAVQVLLESQGMTVDIMRAVCREFVDRTLRQ